MSRPTRRPSRPVDGPAADARAALPAEDAAAFDRVSAAVLSSSALGPGLRAVLPGTSGVRWLHGEGLAPTARPASLTAAQWLSLFGCWAGTARVPAGGAPPARAGQPSRNGHGHAPGAQAAPRWF